MTQLTHDKTGIRCEHIDGLSKLQLVGLTPRHNATALAIAKIPQSIPFDCCVTSSHSRCKMSPSCDITVLLVFVMVEEWADVMSHRI